MNNGTSKNGSWFKPIIGWLMIGTILIRHYIDEKLVSSSSDSTRTTKMSSFLNSIGISSTTIGNDNENNDDDNVVTEASSSTE